MSDCFRAALDYLKLGLHPIPVEPQGKRPLVNWKDYQTRPPTTDEVYQWWTDSPNANVALVLGRGMFAVDIDGTDGEDALLEAGIGLPLDAPTSKTAHGRHVFLAGTVPDRVGFLPKVDIRGVGYVVAPPSVHESGHVYRWETSMQVQPPAAPPNLLALLHQRTPTTQPTGVPGDWLTDALRGVGEGQRDTTCARLAGYLLGKGIPADAVEDMLVGWGERCVPPFPPDQVAKCVASIAKRDVPEQTAEPKLWDIADVVGETLAEIAAGPTRVRATKMAGLDEILDGGLRPGDYVLLGARPSVGKTALALQFVRSVAGSGAGVLVVSREMTRTALMRRMLVQESGLPFREIRRGVDKNLLPLLEIAGGRLAPLPVSITTNVMSSDQLAEALKAYQPGELGLIVVDYLQLMRGPSELRGNSRGTVESISQELKRFAVEYETAVLCLSSLSRPPKDKFGQEPPGWRPSLASLRESGELEHDADIIWLMWRPLDEPGAELNVAKQRDGVAGGVLNLVFDGPRLTFKEAV